MKPSDVLSEFKRLRAEGCRKSVDHAETQQVKRVCPIRRMDDDERLIYAEVYAPFVLDTYGEYMTPEDIRVMCHRFMQLNLSEVIDTNHDNVANGSFPVESYIARSGDPDFTEGSWVLVVKVPDDTVWGAVKSGELNGYSFEAMVRPVETIAEVSTIRDHVGRTRSDKGSDHEHAFFVQVDERGLIRRGITSPGPDGHVHHIRRASYTEKAGADSHSHRFDLF
ncbi:XkdF-like putative serine protease domain-containing protein [Paracoccus sp. MKU1]|uniref:XkdF-like putative serine protease domain-containing protein n=1 Tax=Paracoccus sp. MKU1 TaxID=1745182 RepID=UPI0007190C5F|nr:XkdF-like putative serine protease domain-containing protein [Paracoccus sp. MKU1]KRW94348.1 hypothetical protein AQY21_20680 [Paracoccus sp. MKU1]